MAETPRGPVVNVGEVLNRKLSGFQTGAIAVCALAGIFDGFDIQSIGILAPAIAQNLHIPISAFGTIFSLGWLGVMIGTLISGPDCGPLWPAHPGNRFDFCLRLFHPVAGNLAYLQRTGDLSLFDRARPGRRAAEPGGADQRVCAEGGFVDAPC